MWYQLIISLPMLVCLFWCIFFGVRVFRGEEEAHVRYTILLFYFASTVLYVNHWLFFSGCESVWGTYTYLLANLSVYPLYYMYLHALTRTPLRWDHYVLLIPAVLMAVLFPLHLHWHWLDMNILVLAARVCFAIQVIWVWVSGFLLLRATQRRMDNTYTDYRSYILRPTHTLLVLIGATSVVSTLLNVLGRELFDGSWLVYIPAVLMSVLLYSLGYVAAHTKLPIETVATEENHENGQSTTEEIDELFFKICAVLREEKLFANPHLTIQDVAMAVGSNRTYVSNCINQRTDCSFSQFVAQYRVEHARTVLVDPQYTDDHEALTQAIVLCGFASEQTFYRIFKEFEKMTPLQFRHNNLK